MKRLIFLLLLLLPCLAIAQSSEITDVQQSLIQDGANYFVVTVTIYANGNESTYKQLIGNRDAMLVYAQNSAVNRQQYIAGAKKVVIQEKNLSIREFNGVDTLVTTITGGDTTLFDLNADSYFSQYEGNYTVWYGGTSWNAKIIRLPAGGVRLERVSDGTRWTMRIFSPKNIRILNFPIGALPAATYDLYEVDPTPAGKPVYYEENRIFRLVKQ